MIKGKNFLKQTWAEQINLCCIFLPFLQCYPESLEPTVVKTRMNCVYTTLKTWNQNNLKWFILNLWILYFFSFDIRIIMYIQWFNSNQKWKLKKINAHLNTKSFSDINFMFSSSKDRFLIMTASWKQILKNI